MRTRDSPKGREETLDMEISEVTENGGRLYDGHYIESADFVSKHIFDGKKWTFASNGFMNQLWPNRNKLVSYYDSPSTRLNKMR